MNIFSTRPTVCFAVEVAHAQNLARNFQEKGVRAEAVWGAMRREEYETIIWRFESGETQILVNAKLLVEGWDCPQTSGVIIARPATAASAAVLGPQMIGRALCTALSTGKKDAVIVELKGSDSSKTSGSPRGATLLGAISESSGDDNFSSHISLHEQANFNRAARSWKARENARHRKNKFCWRLNSPA